MHGKFYSVWEFNVVAQAEWLAGLPEILDVLQSRQVLLQNS